MRTFFFVFLASCLNPFLGVADDAPYAVSKISYKLLKNANAVVRYHEEVFEIANITKTYHRTHYAITILNENGDDWAQFSEHYNKTKEITSLEGVLYDATGKQIKKIKLKNLEDISGVDGGSLMDDSRIKRHNFYYKVYPYTIEYDYEISNEASLFFPAWQPQFGDRISVQKSTIKVISPLDYQVRFKAFNYKGEPVIIPGKKSKEMNWFVTDLEAIKYEPYSPSWNELATMVYFAPSDFQMEDYKGNMATWQDFGKFVYSLKIGRETLPESIKQKVHQIADANPDQHEKVRQLYAFMQKNTRYISIQLGIGGWQPFEAADVASKGYGDCKALSNYMYSILKEVSIPSYYTLVKSGKSSKYLMEDFPSQQFDHVILCVPFSKDTMWLECTSQTMPPGYLGSFTCDRPVLLIDENGGNLVRTPVYGLLDNKRERYTKATLDEEGGLAVKVNTNYTGLQQDPIHSMINSLSKEKVKEQLNELLNLPSYEIINFNYKELNTSIPSIDESLEVNVYNYANLTGKRIFINPNILSRSRQRLDMKEERKYEIWVREALSFSDTTELELPSGYILESKPFLVSIENAFGKYSCSVKIEKNKLLYYRTLQQNSGHFPAKSFDEFAAFYEKIYDTDNGKLVFVKN